jgi:hypothetical protein
VGEIIKDHMGIIKIEKLKWMYKSFSHGENVEMIYCGAELKKDLTPFKKATSRDVYECNVKSKIQ